MAAERLSMRKLREVLRLYLALRMSTREIARSCSISPSTVSGYVGRARVAKLRWPLPPELDDDAALERLLFPDEGAPKFSRPEPDWGRIHLELRRKHVTKQLLWEEYRAEHPDGYQYSQFCERYARWAARTAVTMRQTHRAGEKLFVDFSGDGIDIVDPVTGEVVATAKLFVAVLGASNLTYVEPATSEDLPTWVGCHVRALEFIGGVPELFVPDNLKSGVKSPDLYEPDLNPTYAELAAHYGAAVVPTRVAKPRDKAKVENGVLLAERWIIAALRHRTFHSMDELREAVRVLVEKLNGRRMRKINKSRREVFEEIERAALRPLPASAYEFAAWKRAKVNIDYHVEFDGHLYSVPYGLVHEHVELRATESAIEVLHRGRRVASHMRKYERGQTTVADHMPSSHRAHAEWTPSRLLKWASQVGPSTQAMLDELMRRKPHPEMGFRACLGVMRLTKKYDPARVEAACARALRMRAITYKSVKAILSNNLDRVVEEQQPEGQTALPLHENVRGARYYH